LRTAALAFIVMRSAIRTRAQMSAQQATSPATPDTPTDLRERIRAARPSLSPAERQVADWVLRQPGTVLSLPVAAIAREAGVSQPTVIRFCRSMGCHGLSDFKLRLAQGNVARDTAPARVAPPSGMRVLQNAIDSLTTLQGRFDPMRRWRWSTAHIASTYTASAARAWWRSTRKRNSSATAFPRMRIAIRIWCRCR
jgi:DNA-binding CsgD family transcriptional regulator